MEVVYGQQTMNRQGVPKQTAFDNGRDRGHASMTHAEKRNIAFTIFLQEKKIIRGLRLLNGKTLYVFYLFLSVHNTIENEQFVKYLDAEVERLEKGDKTPGPGGGNEVLNVIKVVRTRVCAQVDLTMGEDVALLTRLLSYDDRYMMRAALKGGGHGLQFFFYFAVPLWIMRSTRRHWGAWKGRRRYILICL